MELENIILSEVTQIQKDMHGVYSLISEGPGRVNGQGWGGNGEKGYLIWYWVREKD